MRFSIHSQSFIVTTLFTWLALVGLTFATPIPYDPSPFVSTGQLQGATLTDPADPLTGGTLTVNGQVIVVPKNSFVGLPSITVAYKEIFKQVETSPGVTTWVPDLPGWSVSGAGPYSYEVSITGNRVNGQHIAGLIYLFQELLEAQSGFVTSIDYATGTFYVGGNGASPDVGAVKAILSDPEGVFGLVHDQYPLWTTDTENPSVRASTGFPMCIPRVNPASGDDPLCPNKNRPVDGAGEPLREFTFNPPGVDPNGPDPALFAPLKVGDYVDVSGIWVPDTTSPNGKLLVVYALVDNLGFYTAPGSYPSYVTITAASWGIVGNPAGEFAETRIEGYTTDEFANVEVFAVDVHPCTGVKTIRPLGVTIPRDLDRRGQWRYRVDDVAGPYTREVGARLSTIPSTGPVTTANGVEAGTFITPIMDDSFTFPELTLFGQNVPTHEFNLLPFLAQGSGPYLGSVPGRAGPTPIPIIGQLNPWPGAVAPLAPPCAPGGGGPIPVANAGPNAAFRPNALVTLNGRSDSINIPEQDITYAWTQTAGPTITLANAGTKNPTFTAPAVTGATVFTFTLTASTTAGSSSDTVDITISNSAVDTVTIISATVTKLRGDETLTVVAQSSATNGESFLSMQATGTRPNIPSTPMLHTGNGRYTISVAVEKDPTTVLVTSSWGGSATWTPPP